MSKGDALDGSASLLRRMPALMEVAAGRVRRADPPLLRDTWLPEVQVFAYHNLPTIGGVMQHAGRRFAARDVKYHQDDSAAEISMELAGAYPPEAGLTSWRRTLRLDRGAGIQLTERYALARRWGTSV